MNKKFTSGGIAASLQARSPDPQFAKFWVAENVPSLMEPTCKYYVWFVFVDMQFLYEFCNDSRSESSHRLDSLEKKVGWL